MKRVAIIGSSGAGKSTLSRELSNRTGLPIIHLDVHYWQPGWTETPSEKWRARHKELLNGEHWIIDGNFGSTLAPRIQAADTVVFLDFSRYWCTYRVLKRLVMYQRGTRPDMAEGCHERFDWDFMKFVWTFPEQHRPKILSLLEAYPPERLYHLRSPAEVRAVLASL